MPTLGQQEREAEEQNKKCGRSLGGSKGSARGQQLGQERRSEQLEQAKLCSTAKQAMKVVWGLPLPGSKHRLVGSFYAATAHFLQCDRPDQPAKGQV